MKNICLNTMSKGVAPTELKNISALLFYKGSAPTELIHNDIKKDTAPEFFALSKQCSKDKEIISGNTPRKLFALSKTEKSSFKTEKNRNWNLLFRIDNIIKYSITLIDNYLYYTKVGTCSEWSESCPDCIGLGAI